MKMNRKENKMIASDHARGNLHACQYVKMAEPLEAGEVLNLEIRLAIC
jgi:hypothetical protein